MERSLTSAERRLDALEAAQVTQARVLAMQVEAVAARGPAQVPSVRAGTAPEEESVAELEPSVELPPTFAETADRSLSEQSVDLGWSRQMRGELLELVESSAVSTEIAAVDCRARFCRIELRYASSTDRDRMALDLSRASVFENGVVFEHSEDGTGASTKLYVARQGEELARIAEVDSP